MTGAYMCWQGIRMAANFPRTAASAYTARAERASLSARLHIDSAMTRCNPPLAAMLLICILFMRPRTTGEMPAAPNKTLLRRATREDIYPARRGESLSSRHVAACVARARYCANILTRVITFLRFIRGACGARVSLARTINS